MLHMSSVNGLMSSGYLPQAQQRLVGRSVRHVRLRKEPVGGILGLIISVAAGLLPVPASCADIFVAPPSWTIYINGEIRSGDALKFQEVVDGKIVEFRQKHPNAQLIMIVRPTSLGGSVTEAMEIGRLIRKNALWVFTNAPGQRCASACVFILAAGVSKLPGANTIGIHRPTFPSSEFSTLTSQQALERYKAMSEDVRSYLAEMDIPPILFDEMMQIKSDEIKWLTWNQISAYGLVGETAAYAEWKHAQAIEYRKRLVHRFGEATVRMHESAQGSATRFVIRCMDERGMEFGKACDAEANRRFPDPLKGQDLQ
jgi:ATP-dependent protease ClpP protease subunit